MTREEFLERYKGLFNRATFWGLECDDGWLPLIESLVETILFDIKTNGMPPIMIDQIKEKFGGLSFYYTGGNETTRGMVFAAQALSRRICEKCGSMKNIGTTKGWIKVLCQDCAKDSPNWELNEDVISKRNYRKQLNQKPNKMEKKVYKFPEIEQFRNAIESVAYKARYIGRDENGDPIFDATKELPTLKYRGSVKLHGTNAGLIFVYDEEAGKYVSYAQSREKLITPQSDNAGFATFVATNPVEKLLELLPPLELYADEENPKPVIRVFGEWCGKGIQAKVAITKLEKMFVIFGVKINNTWLPEMYLKNVKLPNIKIYNILDYQTYSIEIDFNNPKVAAEKMTALVESVEKECPVGKAFGIDGVGEGIVWVCIEQGWTESRYWFKTKGEEHKDTKTKEKIPVDVEKVKKQSELIDILLTDHRLSKGIDHLNAIGMEVSRKNLGEYLKWVYNDVIKEELDTIVKNGFEPKEISGAISNKARNWFFKYENEQAGL